jgi:hypothetical protein
MSHTRATTRRLALLLLLALTLSALTLAACAPDGALDGAIRRATRGQRFSIAAWEVEQLLGPRPPETPFALPDTALVELYLQAVAELRSAERLLERAVAAGESVDQVQRLTQARDIRADNLAQLRPHAQRILARQVRAAYRAEGIYNPAGLTQVSFPPLAFTLEPLPHLLIVSPRDRIESLRTVLLDPHLTVEEVIAIENGVEAAGFSALVESIGGLGATYPTFVQETTNLTWTLGTVAEEWLHQYLAFTPLGWRYVLNLLQLRPDYGIARLNESAATIVQEEIAHAVLAAHYPQRLPAEPAAGPARPPAPEPPAFQFNREMRVTRLRVDELLAAGEIEAAEAYMEERRLVFVAEGYALRKLNQAYFAFHGAYAVPSITEEPLPPELVDPLGDHIRQLRDQSASLAEFLNTVAGLRSEADLQAVLGK